MYENRANIIAWSFEKRLHVHVPPFGKGGDEPPYLFVYEAIRRNILQKPSVEELP
jgi:hypothetical protein